jgi:hypothetical protein
VIRQELVDSPQSNLAERGGKQVGVDINELRRPQYILDYRLDLLTLQLSN